MHRVNPAMIANRLGIVEQYDDLKKAAIWGYFDGAIRAGGDNPEVTCIFHTESKDAWFWYIPLSDGTVSVGLVGDNDFLLKRGGSPEKTFTEEMKNCPGVRRRLQDATQTGRFHVAKEFSYNTTEKAGDGWVLVGDAGGFIDPIYSSGVFLALKSGVMAGQAISDGLHRDDLSAKQLGQMGSRIRIRCEMDSQTGPGFLHKRLQLCEVHQSVSGSRSESDQPVDRSSLRGITRQNFRRHGSMA